MPYLLRNVIKPYAGIIDVAARLKSTTLTALHKIIAETFAIDSSTVMDDLIMKDVASWNSLTHIELIVGLEEVFGVQFTEDDVVEMTSVAAIRGVLRRLGVAAD